jgi:Cys-tRNA(Pro)/Cys-tRNA(Cys) deacylase
MDVKMPIKNNVTRLLESRKIPFAVFELPSEKLGAIETARLLDVDPATVYKTIVVIREKTGEKKPLLVVIPGPNQVDLKALAAFLGEKKVYLPTEREAEGLTGLQAGGISPLALLNKGFQVVLDALAREQVEIHVSGGQRGLNIRLPVEDFIRVTNAKVAPVSRPERV